MARYTIEHSKRPLLVAGHGIRLANAQVDLMDVLECGIPVVTTFNGFDLVPSDHPCFVGRIGTVGTYGGNNALRKCDVLICVGTRNNIRQVSYDWCSFSHQAKKIIVDIDDAELMKLTVVGETVNSNAKDFLSSMAGYKYDIDKNWLTSLIGYSNSNPIELSSPYRFAHDFTSALPNNAVVVCGNGTACVCMFQAGIVKKGQRIFWNSGCAAMGYDLPAAIGASIAHNGDVYCVTGDGSIQMNIQELQTIKHYGLPIKIFVLNNNGYRSIELTQSNYFNGDFIGCNDGSGVSFPDLKAIAQAYEIKYFNLEDGCIEDIIEHRGPCICDVSIGNDYEFKPKFTNSLRG